MASRKPPSVASANASLKRLASLKNVGPQNGGWRPFSRVLKTLPKGVDHQLTQRVLETVIQALHASYLASCISPNVLAEVMAALEKFPAQPSAVFALTGLRLSNDPERELSDWLGQQGLTSSFDYRTSRKVLERQLANPAIIAAAQAAFAVERPTQWWSSRYVALLAADASPDSLDVLTPLLLELRTLRDTGLDWFRTTVVPLIGNTAGGRALKQSLEDAVEARTESSPARAFCVAIGMDPPPKKLQFHARFYSPDGEPGSQVRADSTQAEWFTVRPHEGWNWKPLANPFKKLRAELVGSRSRVNLRASGKDVDRTKLQRWLETFLT